MSSFRTRWSSVTSLSISRSLSPGAESTYNSKAIKPGDNTISAVTSSLNSISYRSRTLSLNHPVLTSWASPNRLRSNEDFLLFQTLHFLDFPLTNIIQQKTTHSLFQVAFLSTLHFRWLRLRKSLRSLNKKKIYPLSQWVKEVALLSRKLKKLKSNLSKEANSVRKNSRKVRLWSHSARRGSISENLRNLKLLYRCTLKYLPFRSRSLKRSSWIKEHWATWNTTK